MAQKHNEQYVNAPMTRLGTIGWPDQDRRVIRSSAFVASKCTAENPILQLGEVGYETDTNKLKVGDGVTKWNSLPYAGDGAGAVSSVNGQTGDVVITAADLGATTSSAITVTLVVADWSADTQTVTASGVTATNTVAVAPAPASQADWIDGGVLCTAQGTDELTFTCDTTPSNDITVNVLILN